MMNMETGKSEGSNECEESEKSEDENYKKKCKKNQQVELKLKNLHQLVKKMKKTKAGIKRKNYKYFI